MMAYETPFLSLDFNVMFRALFLSLITNPQCIRGKRLRQVSSNPVHRVGCIYRYDIVITVGSDE